jgi:hypothetical protein
MHHRKYIRTLPSEQQPPSFPRTTVPGPVFDRNCADRMTKTPTLTGCAGTSTTTTKNTTPRVVQRLSLNTDMFYEALKVYIEEYKPDPIAKRQLEGWGMEWTDIDTTTTTTSSSSSSTTFNDSHNDDDTSVQKKPHTSDDIIVLNGMLVISGQYVEVAFQMECTWTTYNSNTMSNNNNCTATNTTTTNTINTTTNNNDNSDGELIYSCQIISARILQDEPPKRRRWCNDDGTSSSSKDTNKDDDNNNGNDGRSGNAHKRIREKTIQRLCQDSYIVKLLQLKQEKASDTISMNKIDGCDSATAGTRPGKMVLANAEIYVHKSQNVLEERVDVTESVAEALRRALWSSTESSLDIIEVILALPSLPCCNSTSSAKGGPSSSSSFTSSSTVTTRTATTTTTTTTPLANRAKLRLLEDAMLDACEREGEDQLIEDLEISPNNNNNNNKVGGDTSKDDEDNDDVQDRHDDDQHHHHPTRPVTAPRRKKAKSKR